MKTSFAASVNFEVCSIVAFEGACTMPKMTPWSSVGASSLAANIGSKKNMIAAMIESPIHAV